MVQLIKYFFKRKRYIKISYIGKFGMFIKSNFTDEEIKDFLYSIYTDQLINDIMEYLKLFKEDQYIRIVKFLEERAEMVNKEIQDNNQEPVVGVLSENNNMGRS